VDPDPADVYVRHLIEGCALHLDRAYSQGHFWLRFTGDGEWDIGLAAHVLRFLYRVDDIVLPRAGVRLKRGDPCGWITRGRVSVPLTAPISGDVVAVHDEAIAAVRESGGREDGRWLYRTRPLEDPERTPGLRYGEDAVAFYLETVHVVKRYLRESLAPAEVAAVGCTLGDGGTTQADLGAVLGQEKYERLVDELFHMQI
jgi:glycine cleavage system H protein